MTVPSDLPLKKFRSSHRRCSIKKVILEILQNSQEQNWPQPAIL